MPKQKTPRAEWVPNAHNFVYRNEIDFRSIGKHLDLYKPIPAHISTNTLFLIFGFSDPVGAFQGNRAFSGFCLSKPSEASSSPIYDRKALRFFAIDAPAPNDHFGMSSVAKRFWVIV